MFEIEMSAVGITVLGFWLAVLANFLEANFERKPPEMWLRINNAILSGITATALCDICVQNHIIELTSVPAYCALLGLMTDVHLWRGIGLSLVKRAAVKHNIKIPEGLKKGMEDEQQRDEQKSNQD